MTDETRLGGAFTLPGTAFSLQRMGYGAMQLASSDVLGRPRIARPLWPFCAPYSSKASITSRDAKSRWLLARSPDVLVELNGIDS